MDSHLHPFWGAELARGTDLGRCRTREAVLAALAASTPQRGWLFAWGLDYDAAPTAAEIGEAVGGAAAFVRLSDLHTALATPRALQLAQVTGPRDFEDGSSEVVCVEGVPTGSCARSRPGPRAARRARSPLAGDARSPRRELRRLNALGLTGAHVMDGEPATHDLLRDLEGTERADPARARAAVGVAGGYGRGELEARLRPARRLRQALAGGVVKFFADGVIDTGTAWLEEPDTPARALESFWPDLERIGRAIGVSRRRASRSRPTRSATPRCASRSTPTSPAPRPAGATGSSTSRRCPTTSSRRSARPA